MEIHIEKDIEVQEGFYCQKAINDNKCEHVYSGCEDGSICTVFE